MANLIAIADGNLTAAGTWGQVETGTSATQTSFSASTLATSSLVYCPAFTITSGHVIDGVLLRLSTTSTSGTITVALSNNGGTSTVASVTVNVADVFPTGTSSNGRFVFFKFTSTYTGGVSDTNCKIGISCNTGSILSVYRSSTAADWCRYLRTTSTASPVAADNMFIAGELTGAGTHNARTVTMNSTANTSYGQIALASYGSLTYGTSASTNYYLRCGGSMEIPDTTSVIIGDPTGTAIPSSSTAVLEFNCASDKQFGINMQEGGKLYTAGSYVEPFALLTANASAGATSLTVDRSTSWKNGYTLGFPSTSRTRTQIEQKALTADASGTTLTVSALTNAHDGDSTQVQCVVQCMDRNVKIRGIDTTHTAQFSIQSPRTDIKLYSTEFQYMGTDSSAAIRWVGGISNVTNLVIYNCSFHDCSTTAAVLSLDGGAGSASITYSNFFFNGSAAGGTLLGASFFSGTVTVDNVAVAGGTGSGFGFNVSSSTFNLSNCYACCTGTDGYKFSNFTAVSITNCHAHSNASGSGLNMAFAIKSLFSLTSCRFLRNNVGITFGAQNRYFKLDTCTLSQNIAAQLDISGGNYGSIYSTTFDASSTYTSTIGLKTTNNVQVDVYNSDFGQTQAFSTGDFSITSNYWPSRIYLNNCRTNLSTIENANNINTTVVSVKQGRTAGNHKVYYGNGAVISVDTSVYNSAGNPSSQRIACTNTLNTTEKAETPWVDFPVSSGETPTISVYVQKNAAYSSSNYPRMILRCNPSLGITSDTVAATATVACLGAFEKLTYTFGGALSDNGVVQAKADCDSYSSNANSYVYVTDWAKA